MSYLKKNVIVITPYRGIDYWTPPNERIPVAPLLDKISRH